MPGVYGLTKVQPWSRGGVEARVGYEAITRLVGLWMKQILGDAARPRASATPLLAALPAGLRPLRAGPGAPAFGPRRDGGFLPERRRPPRRAGRSIARPRASPTRACVLLAHQSGSSRGEYATIAPELARRGYVALAVDLRWGRRDRFAQAWNATARRAGSIGTLEGGDQPRFAALLDGARDDLVAAESYLASAGLRPGRGALGLVVQRQRRARARGGLARHRARRRLFLARRVRRAEARAHAHRRPVRVGPGVRRLGRRRGRAPRAGDPGRGARSEEPATSR